MKPRINLTDGSGMWFNPEKAQSFEEATWFNGHNHVSVVTSDQFAHEKLFLTATGRWVLKAWSQWQGSRDSYRMIDDEAAARWLSINRHVHPKLAERIALMEV